MDSGCSCGDSIMVVSPSKYLSVKFLRKLRENRYCSVDSRGGVKEYCPEEVDYLYTSKMSIVREVTKVTKVDVFIDMQRFLSEHYDVDVISDAMSTWDKQLIELRG